MAYQQARAVGQPNGSAIYFAVDYNAPERDIVGAVQQYFRGVRAALAAAGGGSPPYRVGVYGSGAVCTYMKGLQLADYPGCRPRRHGPDRAITTTGTSGRA